MRAMRHVAWAAALIASVSSFLTAPVAQSIPNVKCQLTTPVQEVSNLAGLPASLRDLLPPLADVGAQFNSTDAVLDPSLPFRRLIRVGHRAQDWFVWYEHGGITYFWQAVVARVPTDTSAPTTLVNAGTIADTLCAVTDGALAGSVPPYPSGTWPENSF